MTLLNCGNGTNGLEWMKPANGAVQMEGFHAESCNKFVLKNLCWVIGGIVAAGIFVGGIALSNWIETDRIARDADTRTEGNTSAIDALTGEVRATNTMVREIGEDLAYVKGRLVPARNASGQDSVAFATPETQ